MTIAKFIQRLAGSDRLNRKGEPVTVLLVDDQSEVAEVTEDLLSECGYTVVTRTDATAALDVLATNPDIDIVVSDVVMPGELGGPDIAEFAKEMAGLNTILISGFPDHKVTTASIGKYEVLLKPFLIEELDERIQSTLNKA